MSAKVRLFNMVDNKGCEPFGMQRLEDFPPQQAVNLDAEHTLDARKRGVTHHPTQTNGPTGVDGDMGIDWDF